MLMKYNKNYQNKDKHTLYSNCPCVYVMCAMCVHTTSSGFYFEKKTNKAVTS